MSQTPNNTIFSNREIAAYLRVNVRKAQQAVHPAMMKWARLRMADPVKSAHLEAHYLDLVRAEILANGVDLNPPERPAVPGCVSGRIAW